MNINDPARFNQVYQAYLNEFTLQGKSPKTIDMYSRCIRQVSVFFDTCPDALTAAQLKAYFLSLVQTKHLECRQNCSQCHSVFLSPCAE
ncbi:MAG: hypothetical protein ACJASL_004854 [Paraglaciecola sp.]|jgi:hypothetical protein